MSSRTCISRCGDLAFISRLFCLLRLPRRCAPRNDNEGRTCSINSEFSIRFAKTGGIAFFDRIRAFPMVY